MWFVATTCDAQLFGTDKTRKSPITHTCYDQFIFVKPSEEVMTALSTRPFLISGGLPPRPNFVNEEKEVLRRVQARLQEELEKQKKEYKTLLAVACKNAGLVN